MPPFLVFNRTQVVNRDSLLHALHDRPPGTALITVTNHHSCMDEPLIWGSDTGDCTSYTSIKVDPSHVMLFQAFWIGASYQTIT